MSVIVCAKVRDGIALAADSRRTLFPFGDPRVPGGVPLYATADDDMKLFSFSAPHSFVGAAIYGVWDNAFDTIGALVAEIEAGLPTHRLRVSEYAQRMNTALAARASKPSRSGVPFTMFAIVAGYDEGETEGRVFAIEVPAQPAPIEQHVNGLGVTYGGMRELIDRVLAGYDSALLGDAEPDGNDTGLAHVHLPIALDEMSASEGAAFAHYLVAMTVDGVRFLGQYGLHGSGGAIDVATITAADGLRYLQQKDGKDFGPHTALTWHRITADEPTLSASTPSDITRLATYTVA